MKVVINNQHYFLIQIVVEPVGTLHMINEPIAYVYDRNGKVFRFHAHLIEKVER